MEAGDRLLLMYLPLREAKVAITIAMLTHRFTLQRKWVLIPVMGRDIMSSGSDLQGGAVVKDGMQLLKEFLDKRDWEAVLRMVAALLPDSEIRAEERAFCYYAECRALSNLDRYAAALAPGQRAVFLATELQDRDLLALCLVEVAWAQQRLEQFTEAAESWSRYVALAAKSDLAGRRHHINAFINLGTCHRALEDREQALSYFLKAWEEGKRELTAQPTKPDDWSTLDSLKELHRKVDRARRMAVWEALELGRLEVAERLIPHGEQYLRRFPDDTRAKAGHNIDLAQLAYLKGDIHTADARALDAVCHAEKHPDLMANAWLILYDVCIAFELYSEAVTAAEIALRAAEVGEQYDLMAQVQEKLTCLYLQKPEVVLAAVQDSLKPKNGEKTGRRTEG